ILLGLVFGLAMLPQMWVQQVIRRHAAPRGDLPGTGSEIARSLLDRMGLAHVKVEMTKEGDHYDPMEKVVRLLPEHFAKSSLSAVVIAAHEVGHAMQDATGYAPLIARTAIAKRAKRLETIGFAVLLLSPLVMLILKAPHVLIIELIGGLLLIGITVVMHAVTLPVEFDASFKRALPLLGEARILGEKDMPAARQILRAAALTYVAAAAMSLLNIARWLRVLRI
ncbi:MAG TPA: zinc metallopeptidase, partial [Hyphomicrobiaceae bacterium]|nr:zinc metallopeptidase [Hyphomicrobiaceae bacterium]